MRKNSSNLTITDLAHSCGVSRATISRVLNNHPGVEEELRKRILDYAAQIQFTPRNYQRDRKVLLICGNNDYLLSGPYAHELCNAIHHELRKNHFHVAITDQDDLEQFDDWNLDAAIAVLCSNAVVASWKKRHMTPIIVTNPLSQLAPQHGVYKICSNDSEAITRAVSLLVSSGHKKIGLFIESPGTLQQQNRHRAFLSTMQYYKLGQNAFVGSCVLQTRYQVIGELIRNGITAIIAATEASWIEMLHSLWFFQMRIPEDISVIGWEMVEFSAAATPSLTTFGQDYQQIGVCCCSIIEKCLRGETPEAEYSIPLQFHDRNSVKAILS